MEEANSINDPRGYDTSNVQHVPDCAADCRAQFLTSLASRGEAFEAMCQTFSNRLENEREGFPIFYRCGFQLCETNSMGDDDQDLSVRQFLSSCQSDGYGSRVDPASPDQAHFRSNSIIYGKEHARRQQPTTLIAAVLNATPSGLLVEGFHTVTTKINPPPASEIAHGLIASGSPVLHLVTTTETSKPLHQRAGGTSQVPSGTKVTIGVSVLVGILAVIALIAWHLRMKTRFRNKKRISRPIKPSSLPPTPLISPSSSYAGPPSGPLTPPPRLQERRFLLTRALSLRRNHHHRRFDDDDSQEWSGMALSPMPPLSPLSISRVRRSPEEGEHGGITATTTISLTTSLTRPLRDDAAPGASVSSIFSSASTLKAPSNASTDSAQIRYSGATATEFPRPPPRVYEAPPVVRGLASPGPPPTRALPSLPADGRMSPLKSPPAPPTSPTRRASPNFASVSRSSVRANEGNGDAQRHWEESNHGARRSVEMALQSPRRVRHVRSPLLNEVCLNSMMKKE